MLGVYVVGTYLCTCVHVFVSMFVCCELCVLCEHMHVYVASISLHGICVYCISMGVCGCTYV